MSMGFPRNRPELVRLLFIASLTCLPYTAARPQALTSDPAATARAVGTAFLKRSRPPIGRRQRDFSTSRPSTVSADLR